MPLKLVSVHLADGFADDCEELIHKCVQTDTLNYQIFCNIWKDMNFALVYQGRVAGAEVAELSEEFLHIAKRYMFGNSSNFEESVAGLFLVYALLHLQPYKGFAPLRITPSDLDAIHCLEEVARRQKRHDVLYILGSVLVEGPVEWHLAERQYGLERQMKKAFDVTTSIDKLGVRPKGVFYRQNEELDLIRELSGVGRRYCKAKAAITGTSKPDRTLSYVDEHVANELGASLKLLISGNERSPFDAEQCRSDAIQKIKQRAMADTVYQMKHLLSTDDKDVAKASTSKCNESKRKKLRIGGITSKTNKSPAKKTSDEEESIPSTPPISSTSPRTGKKNIKRSTVKNKRSDAKIGQDGDDDKDTLAVTCEKETSRKGKVTNKLKGKRTIKANSRSPVKNIRKRKKCNVDSSSSESNIEISDHDDDYDVSSDEERSDEESIDRYIQKLRSKPATAELDVNNTLPDTAALNNDVEIEFIDQFSMTKEASVNDSKEVNVELMEVSPKEKCDEKVSMESKNLSQIFKDKPEKLKRPSQKELKRSNLKAKLGRLGILQVADIEES